MAKTGRDITDTARRNPAVVAERVERFKKVSQRPHRQDRGFSLTDMNSRQDWTKVDFSLVTSLRGLQPKKL